MLDRHRCTGPAHIICPAKDLAGGEARHPLSGVVGASGGLSTFTVSISLCRSLPATLGREGNMAESSSTILCPILYFKVLFGLFPWLSPQCSIYFIVPRLDTHCPTAGQCRSKMLIL